MKKISADTKVIDLFCGTGLLRICFQTVEKDNKTSYISDRHAAILLVKGKVIEKCCGEEIKTYVIKISPKVHTLDKIQKVTKSIIFQRMRNIIHKVVEGVVIKLFVELILSLIHEKEIAYC